MEVIDNVDHLMVNILLFEPIDCLTTGAAAAVAVNEKLISQRTQIQRPNKDFTAPTRLFDPLPAPSSGRVRTVTSPLTVVRQLNR